MDQIKIWHFLKTDIERTIDPKKRLFEIIILKTYLLRYEDIVVNNKLSSYSDNFFALIVSIP